MAGRGTRFVAITIDGLLLGLTMLPVVIMSVIMISQVEANSGDGPALGWLFPAVIPPLLFYIYQCYLISTTGQSLAKRWFKIRIIKLNGEVPGFVHGVLLRSWVIQLLGSIPVAGTVVTLVDAAMIFGESSRCLHDLLAGTIVVVAS